MPSDIDDRSTPSLDTADRGPTAPIAAQDHLERAAALAQRLARMLQRDARVLAVFLEGSLAAGTSDPYSDIDWVIVTEHREPVASLCHGYLAQCAELVYWRRSDGPFLAYSGITAEWLRCDIALLTPQEAKGRSRDSLHVLWDRARVAETLAGAPDADGAHADVERLIDEFLRGLGLLPVLVGRGEYRLGVASAERLRGHLTALLLEMDAVPGRGSALRLDPFLSAESRGVLDAIPSAAATRASMIEAHIACARAFLPRARTLADERGLAWPGGFEAATLRVLRDELGVDPS